MGAVLWLRTIMLLSFLAALLIGIGYLIGGIAVAGFMLILSLLFDIISFLFSDRIVLRSYGARIISEHDMPWLHEMVASLANRAGIPKPQIAIVPSSVPNAFATGRSPRHAVVAVTEGILNMLNREELEAVLGHEITHIKHRDMLIGTVAAMIASAIVYLAYIARWFAFLFSDDDDNSLIALIALAIFAPIAAFLIRMAISRTREYLADEGSAKLTRNPGALARALMKIERGVEWRPMKGNPSTSHLFIVNPFRGSTLLKLFSTHPPTEERIEALRKIAYEMGVPFDY